MMNPLLQNRLFGSPHQIRWRAPDIARIAERFGVSLDNALASVPKELSTRMPEFEAGLKDASTDGREFTFTISTPSVDRMGDTIAVSGWKLDPFRKNPVVLWGHDASSLPIGKASRVWTEANKLKASMKFANSQYASRVRDMVQAGTLKATSVGFIPLKFAFSDDPKRKFGIDFLEQELIEFSIVSIPANAEALIDPSSITSSKASKRLRELDLIRLRLS